MALRTQLVSTEDTPRGSSHTSNWASCRIEAPDLFDQGILKRFQQTEPALPSLLLSFAVGRGGVRGYA